MYTKKLLIFIAAIAVTSMACGFTINIPVTTDVKTGPTVTEEILVPDLDVEVLDLTVSFGAGELNLSPGAESLIEGTAVYNVEDFRPEINSSGSGVEISTGNLEINGFPRFHGKMKNDWDLQLSDRPMDLHVVAGAYKGNMELGGLSLASLRVTDGASDVHLNFAEPNQEVMSLLRYETGASNVVLTNLGNANFQNMNFKGGAGNYELDFSGDLQEDAAVSIEVGLSSLTVSVPSDLNVSVRFEGGLSNINTQGSWGQSRGVYTHDGDGPNLDITIKMGAGNLVLDVK